MGAVIVAVSSAVTEDIVLLDVLLLSLGLKLVVVCSQDHRA